MRFVNRFLLVLAWVFSNGISLTVQSDDLLVTISKETTRITSPLKPDGYPDYIAALNQQLRKDVTPKNNLAVGIWKITGPIDLSGEMRPHFFNSLGMDDQPEEGDYLVDFYDYYSEYLGQYDAGAGISLDEFEQKRMHYVGAYDHAVNKIWSKQTHPEVFGWRQANLNHIRDILKAIETRDHYFNPYVLSPNEQAGGGFAPELISILLPGVQRSRELARMLAIDAHYHLGLGDIDNAMANSIAIHKMGRLTARGGTLVEGLVGIAISGIASSVDRKIIASSKISTEQLRDHLARLQSLPTMPSMVDKINITERYMYLDTTIAVAKYGPSALNITTGSAAKPNPIVKQVANLLSSSFIDWDNVMKNGNYWYDEFYRVGMIKDIPTRNRAYEELEQRLESVVEDSWDPATLVKKVLLSGKSLPEITSDQMSYVMVSLLLPALGAALSAEERALMTNEVSQVAISLELFHHANSRYPTNLAALKGTYIKRLPIDRFSGKGLQYSLTDKGYLLYSFGRDQQDNQGNTFTDPVPGDDISIRRER